MATSGANPLHSGDMEAVEFDASESIVRGTPRVRRRRGRGAEGVGMGQRTREAGGLTEAGVALLAFQPELNRYPHCICWSPLMPLTWIMPFIGHTGIADSTGLTWDFAGPYHINREHMIFGRPTIYLILSPNECRGRTWDQGVRAANIIYGGGELDGRQHKGRMHNICCDNCHSHVARALNEMAYLGFRHWNMFLLVGWIFLRGHYVGFGGWAKTWMPFLVIITIILVVHFVFEP